jgi:3-oxoacyl-[acyl-carrier protein] reductase
VQRTTEDLPFEEWQRVIDLNLTAVFLTSKAAVPLLRTSTAGRIINIGSMAGQTAGYRTSPAYAAAKAAVHSLTRVMAHELAPDGITVNALAPSAVMTERIRQVRDETEREATASTIPLGRYQTPEEAAGWVLYLASSQAGYMTGQTVSVNGGRFMT